jgi:hypothetical protein
MFCRLGFSVLIPSFSIWSSHFKFGFFLEIVQVLRKTNIKISPIAFVTPDSGSFDVMLANAGIIFDLRDLGQEVFAG